MEKRGEWLLRIFGAAVGSLLVSAFQPQPLWAWGMLGGVVGGLTAALASFVAGRSGPWAARVVLALLVAGIGFGALFLLAGGCWITDPRTFQVRPPGP